MKRMESKSRGHKKGRGEKKEEKNKVCCNVGQNATFSLSPKKGKAKHALTRLYRQRRRWGIK
jgi:hypothetical protein